MALIGDKFIEYDGGTTITESSYYKGKAKGIYIQYYGEMYSVNYEKVSIQTRIDEAHDSGSFCFLSDIITKNIPPFSLCLLVDIPNVEKKYWLCSSTCRRVVESSKKYYHEVTLIDPTKLLELYIIGSKSFSIVDGKSGYNTDRDRINILIKLASTKYGFSNLVLGYTPSQMSKNQKNYTFGSGTTLYDSILEISKNSHCLPKINRMNGSDEWVLEFVNFEMIKSQTATININQFSSYLEEQSAEDYCSIVESQLSNVVDRNNPTTAVISFSSDDDFVNTENVCLKLPSNVEQLKRLWFTAPGVEGPTIYIPYTYFSSPQTTYAKSGYSWWRMQLKNPSSFLKLLNSTAKARVSIWIDSISTQNGIKYANCMVFEAICLSVDSNRNAIGGGCYFTLSTIDTTNIAEDSSDLYWKAKDYVTDKFINVGFLNKDQWELLETESKPVYCYYENGSEYIRGFNEKYEGLFSKLGYKTGPWISEQYKRVDEWGTIFYAPLLYSDFKEESTTLYGTIRVSDKYSLLMNYGSYSNTTIFSTKFKVEYIPYMEIEASTKKSKNPTNQSVWTTSARSYNQGANTIDFNLLVPSMQRSVDMLGLRNFNISSMKNVTLGTPLTDGMYVITKTITINPVMTLEGKKDIMDEISYTLAESYEQIAQAIGIDTQYESTNVPSTDVVNRFVPLELDLTKSRVETWLNTYSWFSIGLWRNSSTDGVYKICNIAVQDDSAYFTMECENNIFIGDSIENVKDYIYKKNPITYCDDDYTRETYSRVILRGHTDSSVTELMEYPKGNSGVGLSLKSNVYVEKDPRERLIFQFKINFK